MMTLTFVVCYGFLAFATACYVHGACIKGGKTHLPGYKIVLSFFSILWPLYWVFIAAIILYRWMGQAINFCGEKVSKHL